MFAKLNHRSWIAHNTTYEYFDHKRQKWTNTKSWVNVQSFITLWMLIWYQCDDKREDEFFLKNSRVKTYALTQWIDITTHFGFCNFHLQLMNY